MAEALHELIIEHQRLLEQEQRREDTRREPALQPRAEVDPETRITPVRAVETSRTWIVAVVATLAVLFIALAMRMC